MTELDDARRKLAARYLKGRTLEVALARWAADYDAPAYRDRRSLLAPLGKVIRRLAAEAEARDDTAGDPAGQQARKSRRER